MTDMLRGPTPSGSPLAVPSPHLLPPPLRPPSVDLHALDDDPVDVPGLLHGEVLVPDVREDAFGIPLQRRAPSAASPAAKADLLAPDELEPSDLAGDHRLPAVLEDDAGVRRPVGPAVDAAAPRRQRVRGSGRPRPPGSWRGWRGSGLRTGGRARAGPRPSIPGRRSTTSTPSTWTSARDGPHGRRCLPAR